VTIRTALLLTLGQFAEAQLPATHRQSLIPKLLAVYENEPDPGLHGASEWLLRKWGQAKQLDAVLERLKRDESQLQAHASSEKRRWFVNTQKQNFVIVNGGEFLMGSTESERGSVPQEAQIRIRIGRTFAISAHEVTKAQYRIFQQAVKDYNPAKDLLTPYYGLTDDSAQTGVNWYEAAH
jgi:formylglycine-generating enzyme required for sulfatase activity